MDIKYIPGNDDDYILFVKGKKDKAELISVDGHFRWKITEEDGTEYIARPQSAQ